MFELKLEDARYWKSCVESIRSLVEEGTFNITKEGISLRAMDPSGISMVSFFIPNKAFSKYNIDKDVSIGLDLDNLSKILNSARDDEQLVLKEGGKKLEVRFVGAHGTRRYTVPMIDVRAGADKEPKIAFESHVEVNGDALKAILSDADPLSTYVSFKTDKNSFVVAAKGDPGELEEEHVGNTDVITKLDVTKPSAATFNLEFLSRIMKGCPAAASVQLSLKNQEPIKIDYKIGDAAVAYYLAPYMES